MSEEDLAVMRECLLKNTSITAEQLAKLTDEEVVDRHDEYHS